MSVLNQSGEEQVECPLCMEPLEVDDLNFYPCTCGYQICRFCWHRIRTDENGLCPACRKAYSENPADFTPLSKEQVAQLKAEKRARDQQRKARLSESRKHLATVRVVQKNLVFVVGLPVRLADAEVLRRHEYFGKFGKIHKVVINQSTSYAGSQGPSASAYVTYYRSEDALRAIQSVNNITLDGRLIKSSLGTTKYCSHFMKNQPCPKPDCMYLHDLGDSEASFTKEEMHQGKHQEYERRLHEALAAQVQNKSLSNSSNQSGQNGAPIQKEAWPSLSRNGSPPNVGKERKNSNSESKQSSQLGSISKNGSDGNSINNNNNNVNQLSNNTSTTTTITNSNKDPQLQIQQTQHTNNTTNNLVVQQITNKADKLQKIKNSNKTPTITTKQQNNNENITTNNIKNSQKSSENNKDNCSKLITSIKQDQIHEIFPSKNNKIVQENIKQIEITDQILDKTKELTQEIETTTSDDTDRSTNSSPLAQNLNKMTLYEDNTSFFSPNTFQKLITDGDQQNSTGGSNYEQQNSNILNDSLPDINSTEDWEAAFGFASKHQISTSVSQHSGGDDSPGSSPSGAGDRVVQDVVVSQYGGNSVIVSLGTQNNSDSSFYTTNPSTDLITSHINNSVFTSSSDMRNPIYNMNIPPPQQQQNQQNDLGIALKSQIPPVINGLDQHMYKFFADFHKNSLKEQHHPDFINSFTSPPPQQAPQDHIYNPSERQHNFINEHLQHQNLMRLNEQQILLNMKNQQNQQQNSTPHTLLTVQQSTNHLNHPPNFLTNHGGGGYQQNFLLQNQINLVQNQHNLISGDQHNISLIGNQQNIAQQIIGSTLANQQQQQHTNLLNNGANNPINRLLGQQSTSTTNGLGGGSFNQFSGQTQQLLLNNVNTSANTNNVSTNNGVTVNNTQQQRNVEDELGFDPFHETQKALAELMESEQMLNSQQQHRARLPPPGFSHMNSFGIGLPRPHGSKIMPFMSLGQTANNTSHQNAINSQQSNGWPVSNSQAPNLAQNSGLGVCNDWTTLDPAIVSSSRHFPLVNMGTIREQYGSNLQQLSASNTVNNSVSTLRGLDFTTTPLQNNFTQQSQMSQLPSVAAAVAAASTNGCFNPSIFQQHNGQFTTHLTNGFNTQQTGTTTSAIGQNWMNSTDFQNQIPLPPGFRQNNQQGKTQEC